MARRQRIEIIADILRVCSENKPVGKTQLYYGSELSHSLFKVYLDGLLRGGYLVAVNDGSKNGKYYRTASGTFLLREIDRLMAELERGFGKR